jgi:5-methylthioadenosine/S-adenosylhomocysteine deaminase
MICGKILICHSNDSPIDRGAVAVKNDTIVAVGPLSEIKKNFVAKKTLDRPYGLILPGFINSHTHAAMVLFRGLADDLPLKIWLERYIFPMEAKLNSELIELGTELACAEMIRCGTTSFVDMYMFEDTVASVVDRVGLRSWLGEGLFDFPSPSFSSGYDALEETVRLMDKWKGHSRITITIDPHTTYTCNSELLKCSQNLAETKNALLVIHLAETEWENEEIQKLHGVSSVKYLDNLGLLGDRMLAVHCISLSKDDISLLASRNARVVHCPESNLKLASGVAPLPELLEAGIIVALGTDGAASNNDLDIMSEMDTAAKIHKGIKKDPTLISAQETFSMATNWAAKALHRDDLGYLGKGAKADLIVVDMNQVHFQPCYNPLSQLVYVSRSGDVQDVMVAGRILMENRVLTTIDEEKLLGMLSKVTEKLKPDYGNRANAFVAASSAEST